MRRRRNHEETLPKALSTLLTKTLLPDLQARARTLAVEAALHRRWEHEKAERRTAERFTDWVDQTVEQVGAAWILSCVFVRTLEDRDLLERRRLAGEGAADSEQYFYEIAPSLTARDYLLMVFREVSRLPGAEDLLGPRHNPAWRLSPSGHTAQELLDFFRRKTDDGSLRWTFGGNDTRFLGDLYQDLSEEAQKRYALLQTPDFVERFILDLTLEPAVQEFGLEEVRVIDPTCGSGHFLLGAYERLFEKRLAAKPGLDRREHAFGALKQVYGVDINPYAVAIAKFRLTLSYLEKAGIRKLKAAPKLPLNLVVADSLLYGARGVNRDFVEVAESKKGWDDELFTLEEPEKALAVLGQGYHVVVGNPPYITCKDAALRERYRELYRSCYREYALAAPFTERFFQLAIRGGYVGLINANSFMKREFGKRLVEEVLPKLDLTHVIDTSGAYIPEHGTPTVILIGRNREPVSERVHAILGKRGEPKTPADPAEGRVWSSIVQNLEKIDFEDEFVSVTQLPRRALATHPWSLGGGGATDLKEALERRSAHRLRDLVVAIGRTTVCGEDEVWILGEKEAERVGAAGTVVPLVIGECVRDWTFSDLPGVIYPYEQLGGLPIPDHHPAVTRYLWRYRAVLENRTVFGKTLRQKGARWYEHLEHYTDKLTSPLSIAFAFVATHNHFVLDRGGKVFNRSAPIIKLPEGATEEDHLALLGYLNSSTACFWMKQVLMNKAGSGIGRGIQDESWESRFEFDGTKLSSLPIPGQVDPIKWIARSLDHLAMLRERCRPGAIIDAFMSSSHEALAESLAKGKEESERILSCMCSLQEELDWLVYEAFDLLAEDELSMLRAARADALPAFSSTLTRSVGIVWDVRLRPGHRPFEIVLTEESANGRATAWFDRNRYGLPTDIVTTYSPGLRKLIDARVKVIRQNRAIRLIERPEYKRRWTVVDYDEETRQAAREWLLGAVERMFSGDATVQTTRNVAAKLLLDDRAREVAALLFEKDADLVAAVAGLYAGDAVPYLAGYRYTDSGMETRDLWERTWDLQRREDAGEKVGEIPVPPKYEPKDYRDPVYWRLRGKLDVPKERFISYPGAERDDDKSPLIGWAGWDHLQRARALAALYMERKTQDGWEKARLMPLLAGLLELVPWLKQWHNEPSDDPEKDRAGDAYEKFVQEEARVLGVTLDDLRAWRPENGKRRARKGPARGRRKVPAEEAAG